MKHYERTALSVITINSLV